MHILWSCPCDVSGYSQCGRNYIMALYCCGIPVSYESPLVSLNIDGTGLDSYSKNRLDVLKAAPPKEYVRVSHSIPDRFLIDKNAYLNIGYTVVETEKIPTSWVRRCNQMDGIMTASNFCRDILIRNKVKKPIFVVPHCHDEELTRETLKYNIVNLKSFNFLFMADMTPRKGWERLIEAYCNEFESNESVTLTMKVYYSSFNLKHQEACRRKIKDALPKHHPSVLFYGSCIPECKMSRFINSFDCIVSPHCAEGWGLVCSQAMMLEKPVIATRYSGNLEFMSDDNSYLVNISHFEKVPKEMIDINPNYAGAEWAVIDTKELQSTLRKAFTNQTLSAQKAQNGRKTILEICSYKNVSSKILGAIEQLKNDKECRLVVSV